MNAIELIALKELREHLYKIADRANEKNEGRFQHERVFVLGDVNRALQVVKALEDNTTNKP